MAKNNIPPEQPFTDQVSELGYQYEGTHNQYGNHGYGTLDGWTNNRVEYLRQNEDGTTTKLEYFYNNSSNEFTGVRATTLSSNGRQIDCKSFTVLEEFYSSSYAQANNMPHSTPEGTKNEETPNLMNTGENAPSTPDEFTDSSGDNSTFHGDGDNGDKSEIDTINERADAEDLERIRGINLTEYTTLDKTTFNTEAFEEFKNIIVVDIDDIKKLHRYVCIACNYLTVDIKHSFNRVVTSFDSLNKLTKEKVQSEWDYRITMAENQTYKINSSFNNIISNLKDIIAKDEETDDDKKGSTRYTRPIDEITPVEPTIPVDLDSLNKLTPAIAGAISFTEVISMYTTIGSDNVVQSSLTGNYGLLGLIHRNDKYYYKIIDKATGQVYFVEMNDKSKIEWDERGERKAIEIVGDGANILKLPQEGDVLVRNPEVGDVYFLNGEQMTFDGIDYYFISDNVTGEVGYIPVNTSLSEPVLVSELGSVTSDNISEVK